MARAHAQAAEFVGDDLHVLVASSRMTLGPHKLPLKRRLVRWPCWVAYCQSRLLPGYGQNPPEESLTPGFDLHRLIRGQTFITDRELAFAIAWHSRNAAPRQALSGRFAFVH